MPQRFLFECHFAKRVPQYLPILLAIFMAISTVAGEAIPVSAEAILPNATHEVQAAPEPDLRGCGM